MAVFSDWMQANQGVLWTLGSLSLVMFVGSLIFVPWLILQIPPDYFLGRTRAENRPRTQHPVGRMTTLVAKNLLGAILLMAGLAMIFLPGQGLLTLFMGMMLIDFPGKYRLEQRVVRTPAILRSMNWIRERGGREPIQVHEHAADPDRA